MLSDVYYQTSSWFTQPYSHAGHACGHIYPMSTIIYVKEECRRFKCYVLFYLCKQIRHYHCSDVIIIDLTLLITPITHDLLLSFNTFHSAGECRRQVKILTKYVNKFQIVEFHEHIWNHNEKCIQLSTNMPGIGSLIREIDVDISEMWESKHNFAQ